MDGEKEDLRRIMIRLSHEDYSELEALAHRKGVALATLAREIIQAHLMTDHLDNHIEESVKGFLLSEEFDDMFFEKLGRFFEARKRA